MNKTDMQVNQPESGDIIKMFAGIGRGGQNFELAPYYDCNSSGVYYIGVKYNKEGNPSEQAPSRLSDEIQIIGTGQDTGGQYYRVIRYRDRATRRHAEAVIKTADIGTQKGWQHLRGLGITVLSGRLKNERLADYLQSQGSQTVYQVTDKAGWHGSAYILPSGEILHTGKEQPHIIYNGDTSQAAAYRPSGTLAQWQQQIARYAAGNSRLCLALGTAFAAPLLGLLQEESGGFHLYGDSSDGKTTAARVALSVWAKPSESINTWQGTTLSFSNTAAARNDGLMILDEIGQAAPKVISSTVYGIMNGISKSQGAKDGGNRTLSRWRVLVLSTGEKTPDGILSQSQDWNAGQAARLPSIPAAAQYGIYDTLHGHADGALLSEHIKQAAEQHHGEVGRAFIRLIDETTPAKAQERIAAFMADLSHLSGQARRVAKRFALAAAALELAAPVTGLAAGVGMAGVRQCLNEWLEINGSGKYEDQAIIKHAADFFDRYAHSIRFTDWPLPKGSKTGENTAGYLATDADGKPEYLIIPAVFESEICGTFEPLKVCTVLHKINWLNKPAKGWKVQKSQGGSKPRFYSFNSATAPETEQD